MITIMHWPQWVWLALLMFRLMLMAHHHGRIPKYPISFWWSLFFGAMAFLLLFFGGFFTGGVLP
jgi:hypothetical protein